MAVGFVYDKKCFIMQVGRLEEASGDKGKNFGENPVIETK